MYISDMLTDAQEMSASQAADALRVIIHCYNDGTAVPDAAAAI